MKLPELLPLSTFPYEQVLSADCSEDRNELWRMFPTVRHSTLKVNRKAYRLHFMRHGNVLLNGILSIYRSRENLEIVAETKRDVRLCSTVNAQIVCGKDILASRLSGHTETVQTSHSWRGTVCSN